MQDFLFLFKNNNIFKELAFVIYVKLLLLSAFWHFWHNNHILVSLIHQKVQDIIIGCRAGAFALQQDLGQVTSQSYNVKLYLHSLAYIYYKSFENDKLLSAFTSLCSLQIIWNVLRI